MAVETKVNEGIITSSSLESLSNNADISKALVHEVVNNVRSTPSLDESISSESFVYLPFPEMCPLSIASSNRSISVRGIEALLNGIFIG